MKYKKIPKDYIKVCLDRLTRFKPVGERYERVFSDILNKFLISKPENDFDLHTIAGEIFNASIPYDYDAYISNILTEENRKAFFVDSAQEKLMNVELNLTGALKYISDMENLPNNIKKLINVERNRDKSFLLPVKKLILTEGATEEILLSEFASQIGYDFNKNGILVLGAGGKNQVARKYYKMVEEIKLPIFILLDCDAKETKELILPKLRSQDEIYLIKSGEFEDILPVNLIIDAINFNFSNNLRCCFEDFNPDLKMTKNLHNLFKNKGFGEYKKAEFAKMVKNYLENNKGIDIGIEISEIINKIKLI